MQAQSYEVDGIAVPTMFYGTAWKEDRTSGLTRQALQAGFRAIDTANQRKHYIEADVGAALREWVREDGGARDQVFIQTKFTYTRGQDDRLPYDPLASFSEQVRQSVASSLEHLGVEWIDSLVLHGPWSSMGISQVDYEVWQAMEAEVLAGRVRLLGVSNANRDQIALLHDAATIKPVFVQNRCFARGGWDRAVRTLCDERGMRYQGFSLLTANASELSRPAVTRIARRTGRSIPEVIIAFALHLGMIVLTGTSSVEHMRADLAASDSIDLDHDDIAVLERIGA